MFESSRTATLVVISFVIIILISNDLNYYKNSAQHKGYQSTPPTNYFVSGAIIQGQDVPLHHSIASSHFPSPSPAILKERLPPAPPVPSAPQPPVYNNTGIRKNDQREQEQHQQQVRASNAPDDDTGLHLQAASLSRPQLLQRSSSLASSPVVKDKNELILLNRNNTLLFRLGSRNQTIIEPILYNVIQNKEHDSIANIRGSSSSSSSSSSSRRDNNITTVNDELKPQPKQQLPVSGSSLLITEFQMRRLGLTTNSLVNHRVQRATLQDINPECEFQVSRKPTIFAIRCDEAEVTEDGSVVIRAFSATRVYLIGRNLYSNLTVAITEQEGSPQDDCTHADRIKSLHLYNFSMNVAEISIELPPPEKSVPYYFCIREDTPDSRWFHQGSEPWLKIHVKQDFMPLWAKVITIAILLSASGLFSGLNLGLMALDKNELQVIMKCGSDDEKRYATIIEPVRRRGNYLLCSILFSNTLVNSTISVFLEDLSDGLIAIMTSTVLIVLFGEILPQAFCSRHGLAVGAKTIWLTNFCMFVTFPLSYPVSYCLDWALGEEIGHAYDRERLMEFIQVTRDVNNLEADEVNIISGALKIKSVQISEVMTRIEDVYMLDENAVLDFDTIQAIVSKGYSRIPVHESGNRRNIKAVLFAKDLALVDPDDRTPVQTMISFYNHPRMFVFEDTTLDKALNEFKTGKSHMAIVQRVTDDGDRDPYYEVTGIVTLEDVIEEIMQMEINDETDTLTDNRRKRRRKDAQVRKDFSQFTNLGTGDVSLNVVTPQLCLAAYLYMSTAVEPFTAKYLSNSILRRLLSQKIFYKVRLDDDKSVKRLYTAGEPADYFIMILEGHVHVICGKENLVFDGGPFSFFGKAALTQVESADSLNTPAATGTVNAAGPTTPGGSLSAGAGGASGATSGLASTRRDSTRPVLSRRESLAKIVTSQLSLTTKKVADIEQKQVASVDMSPTGSAGPTTVPETMELLEKGTHYFTPDYTVDVIANTSYLKVTRNDYITALRATCVEREGASALGEDLAEFSMIMDNSQMFHEQNKE